MAEVSLRKVVKRYDDVEAVRGIDLDIADHEFVVLVGPSGCGKSTTLRMIAGLEDITDGDIAIGGDVVNDVPPKDRDIAMVFQNYALYPHMTVAENMSFALRLKRASKAEITERTERAAKILGLAKLRVQMRTEIKELHQRLKTTTVYVTHDQIEAMTMADKIVVLHDGVVEQIGAPLELYDKPQNLFVAGFIGSPSMNFLPGVVRANGHIEFEGKGGVRMPLVSAPSGSDGREAVYGVRPEHFALAHDGAEAVVQVVEPTGSEVQVVAQLGGTEVIAAFRERHPFKPGDKIRLKPNPQLVHLFDAASGQRLNN